MTRITLSASEIAKLQQLCGKVEICDDSGKVIGTFTPQVGPYEIPFTQEEIEQFSKEEGGRSLKDIFKDLNELP